MVILSRSRSALESESVAFGEELAKCVEARIRNVLTKLRNGLPVLSLLGAGLWVASEEVSGFTSIEWSEIPALGVETVLVLSPVASEAEE